MKATDYTICITNFSRPDHLRRCLESVKHLPNVVVASYGAGDGHGALIDDVRPGTPRFITPEDHGCNRLWIHAVEMAETPWVVILHDDDRLVPAFERVLEGVDPSDACFIGWNGISEYDDGRDDRLSVVWRRSRTEMQSPGLHPTVPLLRGVSEPHDGFVKSPVTMMLRHDLALRILRWCERELKDFHTRPTMMIGNEIALLFGHLKSGDRWFHVPDHLVRFGNWDGSETVKFLSGTNPELLNLYNGVRSKLGRENPAF